MTVNKIEEGDKLIIKVEGRLDAATAPKLEEEVTESIRGVKKLEFDFEKLEYISSAGLRVLLSAQKTMNKQGSMAVLHVNETIMEIFEVTGFNDILTIQ